MKKCICIALAVIMVLSCTACGDEPDSNTGKSTITKEEAYGIYYETIEKFTPELMTEPQECDVEIKTRDEVTYSTIHFVRNTTVNIKSKSVDGKLAYYLLNQFPEADKMGFYCINDDKFYHAGDFPLNGKGKLVEDPLSAASIYMFTYLNTPQFEQNAIKSFSAETSGSDTKLSFVVDGSNMQEGYTDKVMFEIIPDFDDKLEDVKITLTLNKDGIPKAMSTEIAMYRADVDGSVYASKKLNKEFVFNKFDNVDFDLQELVSQYAKDPSVFE